MKLQFAAALILGAYAIGVREESADADERYDDGFKHGVEAAKELAARLGDRSEDYIWGYIDALTEAMIPGWEDQDGEGGESYEGDDYEHGDAKPTITLPDGVTLADAYDFCKRTENAKQEGCPDLVNYCKVEVAECTAAQ